MGKKGLWANIHAKRKRGEAPAKPGEEGYPTDKALKDSAAKLDPSKRDLRIQKRALKKEAREHNKAARKTEGTRLQQFLRRNFGKNKPKEQTPVAVKHDHADSMAPFKRCWKGYKAVPGKKPYSPGSCKKA